MVRCNRFCKAPEIKAARRRRIFRKTKNIYRKWTFDYKIIIPIGEAGNGGFRRLTGRVRRENFRRCLRRLRDNSFEWCDDLPQFVGQVGKQAGIRQTNGKRRCQQPSGGRSRAAERILLIPVGALAIYLGYRLFRLDSRFRQFRGQTGTPGRRFDLPDADRTGRLLRALWRRADRLFRHPAGRIHDASVISATHQA